VDQIKEIHSNQLFGFVTQPVEAVFVGVKDFALSDQQGSRREGCHHLPAGGKGPLQGLVFLPQSVQGLWQFQSLILRVSYGAHDIQV
jgi:hypothetical protein